MSITPVVNDDFSRYAGGTTVATQTAALGGNWANHATLNQGVVTTAGLRARYAGAGAGTAMIYLPTALTTKHCRVEFDMYFASVPAAAVTQVGPIFFVPSSGQGTTSQISINFDPGTRSWGWSILGIQQQAASVPLEANQIQAGDRVHCTICYSGGGWWAVYMGDVLVWDYYNAGAVSITGFCGLGWTSTVAGADGTGVQIENLKVYTQTPSGYAITGVTSIAPGGLAGGKMNVELYPRGTAYNIDTIFTCSDGAAGGSFNEVGGTAGTTLVIKAGDPSICWQYKSASGATAGTNISFSFTNNQSLSNASNFSRLIASKGYVVQGDSSVLGNPEASVNNSNNHQMRDATSIVFHEAKRVDLSTTCVFNQGTGGRTLANMLAAVHTDLAPYFTAFGPGNVTVRLQAGINDILQSGLSGSALNTFVTGTVAPMATAYADAVRADGGKCVLTCLYGNGGDTNTNGVIPFNNSVRTNWRGHANGLADFGLDPVMGTGVTPNVIYNQDNTHAGNAGYALMAPGAAQAVLTASAVSVSGGGFSPVGRGLVH